MKTIFKDNDLQLTLTWDGDVTDYGKCVLGYELLLGIKLLTAGNDLKLAPSQSPDSLDAVVTALSFFTTQKGDTDASYFDHYNADFLQWIETLECETLKGMVMDFEDKDGEYFKTAKEYFEQRTVID